MTAGLEIDTPGGPSGSPGSPASSGPELRFVAVRANLLPREVLADRAADVTRRRVVLALAALVAVLGLGLGLSWWQTHSAQNALAAEQQRATTLQAQTRSFAPLVAAQGATSSVHTQLQHLLAGDLSWQQMLAALQAKAPRGVLLTQVSGSVSSATTSGTTASTPASTALPTGGAAAVGTLTVTGTAPDKDSIADYTDALSHTTGLGVPFLNSVTTADHGVSFNITVPITSAALGGRWTSAGTHTGGN